MEAAQDASNSLASTEQRPAKRQRASRKGQPQRFSCPYEDCGKKYSRAEHLARHELNHRPKELFQCDVVGCNNTFVRSDLFARHKRKHEESAALAEINPSGEVPPTRQSIQATIFPSPVSYGSADPPTALPTATNYGGEGPSYMPELNRNMATDTSASELNTVQIITNQQVSADAMSIPAAVWTSGGTSGGYGPEIDAPSLDSTQLNFAEWLLDSNFQAETYSLPNFPYLDYSMQYSPADSWGLDQMLDQGLPTTQHQQPMPDVEQLQMEAARHDSYLYISEGRRTTIVKTLSFFLTKKRPLSLGLVSQCHLLATEDGDLFPNVTTRLLERCLAAFWQDVSKQMPIVHQGTFDSGQCHRYLLLAMLALGAAQLVRLGPVGTWSDHQVLADLIMINLRWDIFTDDDAQPPMQLWAAQSLLLVELYEKMYSTRSLHERSHIHHNATITLLRRGSPLVARDGSETPPSGMPTRCGTPIAGNDEASRRLDGAGVKYWRRWSRVESMNRVVFAAFQMDALHAVMFGHESALFPYEIRLPLPCDETLWTASTPEEVQRLEASFSMHGIRPINFLDGLKRCLHGQEVHSHPDARTILMSGLLSVRWHVNKREDHMQFLGTAPPLQEQDRWRSLFDNAYQSWRHSFEQALIASKPRRKGKTQPADCVSNPGVMFHLANITARVDIIDLQILAGSKRLLGRKVSTRDHLRVAQRMRRWAMSGICCMAVHHAFKLLHETLVHATLPLSTSTPLATVEDRYSCRSDPSIYRPWVLYLAALTIWASQYAYRSETAQSAQRPPHQGQLDDAYAVALRYISSCATLENAERLALLTSTDGCCAILTILSEDFANAVPEILVEASKRLRQCQSLLRGAATAQ